MASEQELVAGRDILEDDPVLDAGALVQERVHAERIQHPRAETIPVQIIVILNIIGIVPAVACNVYSKDICDGGNVVCEGAGGQVPAIFIDGTVLP